CPAMCDDYARKDSRIRVIHKSNGGLGSARNAGINSARGEYISFIDSDDYVVPEYLGRLYSMIEANGADISCCMYTTDAEKLTHESVSECHVITPSEAVMKALAMDGIERTAWGKLYRTKIFTAGGIYYHEGIVCEDLAVMPDVFGSAGKISFTESPMYFYRLRSDSIMYTSYSAKSMDYYEALSIAKEQAQKRFPNEWPRMSKYFRDDYIQNTMKILREVCLSHDRNSPEYPAIISDLTKRITLRDAIGFMFSSAYLPKKLAALLTAIAPKLAVNIIERSRKYVPGYN
ncbi:MAG: glycosyltransferase, partial [Synergistaceae bacterium]|nr:glycosyltransferase [Synergistaceae bacterium]